MDSSPTWSRQAAVDRVCRAELALLSVEERRARAWDRWECAAITDEELEWPEEIAAELARASPGGQVADATCVELLLPEERARLEGVTNEYLERRLLAIVGVRISVDGEAEERAECPCCGYLSLPVDSFFQLCRVCFWQNDGGRAGANAVPLDVAAASVRRIGAVEERFLGAVLPDGRERYRRARSG
jgi:hypothetical protein